MRAARLSIGLVALAAAVACASPAPADGSEVALAAHHARYRLTLARSAGPKAPADVNGMIDYQFSGSACAGFGTAFRQLTVVDPPEGDSKTSDMTTLTIEDAGSTAFRFETTTTDGGSSAAPLLGRAAKVDGGLLAIKLDRPKPNQASLGKASFPTEHLKHVIEAAKRGDKTLAAPLFDGSDTGLKIYDTFTVIGPAITGAPGADAALLGTLSGMRRWPVSIGYYERGTATDEPSYVMSFELYENGVSRSIRIDYGTFELSGTLEAFTPLPSEGCGPGAGRSNSHNG